MVYLNPVSLLIFARLAPIVFVVPSFGSLIVPWKFRALLLILLTVLVSVSQSRPLDMANAHESTVFLSQLLHEGLVGTTLCLGPAVLLWGIQVAGQSLQNLGGLSGSNDGGEDLTHSRALGQFFQMFVLAIFFTSGGHRQVVQGVFDSFVWLPPGTRTEQRQLELVFVEMLGQSFELGVRSLTPLMLSLLIGALSVAAIQRIVPQISQVAASLHPQVLVLLGSLVCFMGAFGDHLHDQFMRNTHRIEQSWSNSRTVESNPTPTLPPSGVASSRHLLQVN